MSWEKLDELNARDRREFCKNVHVFLDILSVYDFEDADVIRDKFVDGNDVYDLLADLLYVHDESAGEMFLDCCHDFGVKVYES